MRRGLLNAFHQPTVTFPRAVYMCSGSHIENWHYIVRRGLLNASNTHQPTVTFPRAVCMCSGSHIENWHSIVRRGLLNASHQPTVTFPRAVCVYSGSHIENWHSIVRRGLLNASNTQLQLNGAAYGDGIYLSPTAVMSFGYTKQRRAITLTSQWQKVCKYAHGYLPSCTCLQCFDAVGAASGL